jgi:hypothetical protein
MGHIHAPDDIDQEFDRAISDRGGKKSQIDE